MLCLVCGLAFSHPVTSLHKFIMLGFLLQADQRVLRELIVSYLPDLDAVLKEHDIGMSSFTKLTPGVPITRHIR